MSATWSQESVVPQQGTWSSEAAAQQNDPSKIESISIAVNHSSYPYHFKNEQGEPDGLIIDYWKMWSEKTNINVDFKIMDWSQTIEQVSSGNVDVHAGLATSVQRSRYFDFTEKFFDSNSYIFLRADLVNINNLNQLSPYAVGVVRNSAHVEVLNKLWPKLTLRQYDTRYELYHAALDGEIMAVAGVDQLSRQFERHSELINAFPAHKRIEYYKNAYVGAVTKGNISLLSTINSGFALFDIDERSALERKWFGVEKNRDVLKLAFSNNLPPYMATSPTGKPQGMFIDMWRLWSTYSGEKIEFIGDEQAAAVDLVKTGQADVHIAFPENLLEPSGLTAAYELYGVTSTVFVKSMFSFKTLEEMTGMRVGAFTTAPYLPKLKRSYPNIDFVLFSNHEDMVSAAERNEISGMVSSYENMQAHLIRQHLQNSYYVLDEPMFTAKVFSLISPFNEALMTRIQEGFALIPIEELIRLEDVWSQQKGFSYFDQISKKVSLTAQEQAWLLEHPVVQVGIEEEFAPFERLTESGELEGINIDIYNLLTERTGIEFEYNYYDSWQQTFDSLINGDVELVAGITATDERKATLSFTDDYWEMPWVALYPSRLGNKKNMADFKGQRIAITKGYHLTSYLRENFRDVNLLLVDHPEEGYLAIQQNKVDALLEPLASAAEFYKRETLSLISMSVMEDLPLDHSSLAMSKDNQILHSILNKALRTITTAEKDEIYERWFDIQITTGLDKNYVVRVASQIGGFVIIVILIIIIWNRRLYTEIRRREALEKEMKHLATHDSLTGLPNRNLLKDRITQAIAIHQRQNKLMAVLFIDLDGFKTINDSFGHDVGDELLVTLGQRLTSCVRKSDTLARFGGDEFVLLLTGLNSRDEAGFIAEKILKITQQPFSLSSGISHVGCSIGIAMYPDDGTDEVELLKIADTLMYRVKSNGKNHYQFN